MFAQDIGSISMRLAEGNGETLSASFAYVNCVARTLVRLAHRSFSKVWRTEVRIESKSEDLV